MKILKKWINVWKNLIRLWQEISTNLYQQTEHPINK